MHYTANQAVTPDSLYGERYQVQARPIITQLSGILLSLIVAYFALHWVLPPDDGGGFFWDHAPAQWLDWFFWSGVGVLVYLMSTLAAHSEIGYRSRISAPVTMQACLSEMLQGLAVALIVLWAAVNVADFDWSGIKLNLEESPGIAVLLAFALGFYPRVARQLFVRLFARFLRRTAERVLGRSLGDRTDDADYVELHVDPRLRPAYWLVAGTEAGQPGHKASRDKRVGYKVAGFISEEGFTVNALRTVFIAKDLLTPSKRDSVIEILAHEASHVAQGDWSDSLRQEAKAYKTDASVMEELKARGQVGRGDTTGWLLLSCRQAEDRVRGKKSKVPLYGIIPRAQKKGLEDKLEFVRQAVRLGLDR